MGLALADVMQELRRYDFNSITNIVSIKKTNDGLVIKIEDDGKVKSRTIKNIETEL